MCGINGFITKKSIEKEIAEATLAKMNNKIIHRGPDQDGFFIDTLKDSTIGFAMRRLSIIDLESGKQPIFSDDLQKVIVFNGEIYNYRVLRAKLQNEGVGFHTESDTEVILKLYEKYGTSAFGMLDGMFAFSILDKTVNKVLIARDFFGEKPLYYSANDKGLIWCSELKSLMAVSDEKPVICTTGLNLYLQLTYIPAPYTIYEGVKKLEANHYISYDLSTNNLYILQVHPEKTSEQNKQNITFENAKKKVRNLVEESVLSRSVSDVPIGTFLSGGVDSSIVTLCLARIQHQKINTFSIGFEKKTFDETDKSRIVADLVGSNHHEFIIGEKDFSSILDDIILNFDEPFADSSALPSYIVARKTRDHVTVALTGDGGDEVFGGYNKYLIGGLNRRYTKIIPQKLHKASSGIVNKILTQKEDDRGLKFKIKKTLNSIDYGGNFYYNIIKLGFNDFKISEILLKNNYEKDPLKYYKKQLGSANSLTDFRNVDKKLSLEGDMLVKVDRTSMLASLESRAPFLNKTLWDYTHTLPEEFLLKGNEKKRILKKAFENDFPKDFLEKTKQGFGVPVGDWLKTSLKEELMYYSQKHLILEQNIFNYEGIHSLVKQHVANKIDNSFQVWTFYCFQKWYFNIYCKI